jgi:hypothetical protein
MATTRTTGSLTVTVQESCITLADDKEIKIELDDDLNGGVTCFEPNQDIYLRFYLSPQGLSITAETTNGSLYATGGGGTSEHTEEVTITDGEGSASYPINSISSIEWVGNAPCSVGAIEYETGRKYLSCPSCSGSPEGGSSCEVTYGVVRITYTSLYKTYVLNVPEAGKVVVYAYENL